MRKLTLFSQWIENVGTQPDPNQTQPYMPSSNNVAQSTQLDKSFANAPTVHYDPNNSVSNKKADPEVVAATQSLQQIHGNLRNIFAQIKGKATTFRFPKMKSAFERELINGIDSVGRSHAIIQPSAMGAESEND